MKYDDMRIEKKCAKDVGSEMRGSTSMIHDIYNNGKKKLEEG